MTGFFEGVSNFFARHRAHCPLHDVYQSDCIACDEANEVVYIEPPEVVYGDTSTVGAVDAGWASPISTGDASVGPSTFDTSSADSPAMDSSSGDTSGFSGFGGGDSGGGGASGDF